MRYGAFGLVEVLGSSNAILVIDQMLKTSEVAFRTWNTKCWRSYNRIFKRRRGSSYGGSRQCKRKSAL